MERTPEPDSTEGTTASRRRFDASRLRPRAAPIPQARPTPTTGQPEPLGTPSPEAMLPEEGDAPFAPRGLGGGRIQVVGFPGCLIVSVVLSLLLTLLLNVLL